MANFSSMRLTAAGFRLRAAAEIGQPLTITRVGLGTGRAPDDISGLTALVDERQSAEIEIFGSQDDGTGLIRFYLTNAELQTGYELREIGVYAIDPGSGEELLIDYTSAGDEYDLIPAAGGATVVEQRIDLITAIRPTENIVLQVTSATTVTRSEFEALEQRIEEMQPQEEVVDALLTLTTSNAITSTQIINQERYLMQVDDQLQQLRA